MGATVTAKTLSACVRALRQHQRLFDETGGCHGAGLFTFEGAHVVTYEDVGRHNAVDKVVGRLLLDHALPAHGLALFVSSRASFEIVQKAWAAGFGTVVAVSAPTTLAIQTAKTAAISLFGFVRDGSAVRYHP